MSRGRSDRLGPGRPRPGPRAAHLSLERIEKSFRDEASEDDWPLVRRVKEARKKPVGSLTAEDLRLLIGQGEGVRVLVPTAVALLRRKPLVSGDLYPGDLLETVLALPAETWKGLPQVRIELEEAVRRLLSKQAGPELSLKLRRIRRLGETFLTRAAPG